MSLPRLTVIWTPEEAAEAAALALQFEPVRGVPASVVDLFTREVLA